MMLPNTDKACSDNLTREISDELAMSIIPVVSVAMITYNHECYIGDAIEGVLRQVTSFPFELVIGEDCSNDRTRDIVLEYQQRYPSIIRVLFSDVNVGMHQNILRTERACRGKYISYCEGDDKWVHPGKIQLQAQYLEEHPECGLTHGDINGVYQIDSHVEQNVIASRYNNISNINSVFESILAGKYIIFTCTVCLRKSLLNEYLTNEPELINDHTLLQGDLPRWLYISYVSDVHFFNETMSIYRVLAESASHSKSTMKKLLFSDSSIKIRKYFSEKYNVNHKIKELLTVRYLKNIIRIAYHSNGIAYYSNDKEKARNAYIQIKNNNGHLTIRELIQYYGSQSIIIKIISLPLMYLGRVCYKK